MNGTCDLDQQVHFGLVQTAALLRPRVDVSPGTNYIRRRRFPRNGYVCRVASRGLDDGNCIKWMCIVRLEYLSLSRHSRQVGVKIHMINIFHEPTD